MYDKFGRLLTYYTGFLILNFFRDNKRTKEENFLSHNFLSFCLPLCLALSHARKHLLFLSQISTLFFFSKSIRKIKITMIKIKINRYKENYIYLQIPVLRWRQVRWAHLGQLAVISSSNGLTTASVLHFAKELLNSRLLIVKSSSSNVFNAKPTERSTYKTLTNRSK